MGISTSNVRKACTADAESVHVLRFSLRRLAVLLTVLLASPWAAAATFDLQGTNLTVTTAKLSVSLRGADVVGIVNRLTGESYARPVPGAGVLLNLEMTPPANGTLATSGGWSLDAPGTTATLKFVDAQREVTMTVRVDDVSQEVVLGLEGKATAPGVMHLSWGIAGLDLRIGRFVLPASGGVSLTAKSFEKRGSFSFSVGNPVLHWEAPLSLFQTAQGGFATYSTDTRSQDKRLALVGSDEQTANEQFGVEAPGPWQSALVAGPIEWRLAAYSGEWQAGARIYRDWHKQAMPRLAPDPATSWIGRIRTVVRFAFTPPYDPAMVDALPKYLDPAKTMLYIHNWRVDEYDVNYPDYTPVPTLAALVKRAQQLGFRVMLHTDMVGVSPSNPDYAALSRYQAKDPLTLTLQGWLWDQPPQTKNRFAIINPASAAYRSLFIQRLTPVMQSVAPDALHLDISGWPVNDGNGLIDGLNYNQGAAQLHRDIVTAFPGLILGGEGTNDTIAPMQSFNQQGKWPPELNPDDTPPVPITAYVLPSVQTYGHLGVLNPDETGFMSWYTQYEGQAILPTFATLYYVGQQPDYALPDWVRYARIVDAFQKYDLEPAWDTPWNGAVVQYRGANGASARTLDSGTLAQFILNAAGTSSVLYSRVHASNVVDSPSSVPGWPAFDGARTTGLDPSKQFWLDGPANDPARIHVSGLPTGVKLGLGAGTLVTPGFAYFRLLPVNAALGFDFLNELWKAKAGTTYANVDGPMENGAVADPTTVVVGGTSRPGIFMHPPFNGQSVGATYLEYAVPVPDAYAATFVFAAGINDSAAANRTVPMSFGVMVNGVMYWQKDISPGAWSEGSVDLTAFIGQTALIRIFVTPGPSNNTSFAHGAFAGMRLALNTPPELTSFTLASATPLIPSNVSTFAGTVTAKGNAVTVSDFPLGESAIVFTATPAVAAIGQSLFALPFTVSLASDSDIAGRVRDTFTGTIQSSSAGGVSKTQTLAGFAPLDGQTIMSWPLTLPNAASIYLSFSVGLRDNAAPLPQGVGLSVRINGKRLWEYTVHLPSAWREGVVDLSSWSGQRVIIELIADSLGMNGAHWTSWAELALGSTAANACAIAASPTPTLDAPADGMNGTINIVAGQGCVWSASSDTAWLSLSTLRGTGSGPISYSIAANPGPPRKTSFAAGGRLYTVAQAGLSGAPATRTVVEYYNQVLDHYFITWVPDEIAQLDAGAVIRGWTRTGLSFKTYAGAEPGASPVCRYYIPPGLGDSHFFGRGTVECSNTGFKNPSFVLEDAAFMQMLLPAGGNCASDTTPIYRVFSNRPDANHRYMTDKSIRDQMSAKGWLAEGDGPDLVVMCAPH